jgi:lincosamide nucleotidyltransferase A/C/D/E
VNQYEMPVDDVTTLLQSLDAHDVDVRVGGGWAVDALLGEQTRPHSDLDIWLPATHLEPLFVAFAEHAIDRIYPWPGDRPWNFVVHDGARRRVDLHLYEVLPDGSIHYGSVVDGYRCPAEALSGRGTIAGRAVRCDAPEWAVRWHTGYTPRPVDRHDVTLLCNRFTIDLPEAFR